MIVLVEAADNDEEEWTWERLAALPEGERPIVIPEEEIEGGVIRRARAGHHWALIGESRPYEELTTPPI